MGIFRDITDYARQRKKWLILPIVLMLLLIGLLPVVSESSVIAPFIYTLF